MARTSNEMLRGRRAAIRRLRQEIRKVISAAHRIDVYSSRVLASKKMPELRDLDNLAERLADTQAQINDYLKAMQDAFVEFTIV